ncbi:hypothetical protein EI94DRAFT_714615 [Lactarius quietus]|nr:hypothetical protein EI94DRAFT_714615 [Lactarius quietus]
MCVCRLRVIRRTVPFILHTAHCFISIAFYIYSLPYSTNFLAIIVKPLASMSSFAVVVPYFLMDLMTRRILVIELSCATGVAQVFRGVE